LIITISSLKLNVHTIHLSFNEVHYCLTFSWSNKVIHVFASMNFSEHKWFSTLHWKFFNHSESMVHLAVAPTVAHFSCLHHSFFSNESSCWQRNFPTSGITNVYNGSSIYKLTDVFSSFHLASSENQLYPAPDLFSTAVHLSQICTSTETSTTANTHLNHITLYCIIVRLYCTSLHITLNAVNPCDEKN
jgi:hypothetical protein